MSKRKIAASLGMSATAAGDCIRRARRAGVGWPLPEGLTEQALRAARLRHRQAAIEDVDFRTPRRLDKALFQQLATSRWIAERRSCWSPARVGW